MEISVIIPCRNEEITIGACVSKAKETLEKISMQGEIIVVDNDSSDKSAVVAEALGAKIISQKQHGYGNALLTGFLYAKGKYIVMADADGSYDFSEIFKFILPLQSGYDFVIGNRLKGALIHGAMPFMHRIIGTPILSNIINLLFNTQISDCNCGMRAFTNEAIKKMKLTSSGMEIASEMILKACQAKLKIKEIPITIYPTIYGRKSHLRPFRDGLRHLKIILMYSPTYLFMLPSFVFIALGILGMSAISRMIFVFGLQLQSHFVILGGLLTIVGIQILYLGLSVKAYAYKSGIGIIEQIFIKVFANFRLEKHLIYGVSLFLTGFASNLYILIRWLKYFGQLFIMNDLATISSTIMIVGVQVIFSSLYLSLILNLETG